MFSITVEKQNGNLTAKSKEILIEQIRALGNGFWTVQATEARQGYSTTRYKWYFGCVLPLILDNAARYYRIVNPKTGEQREPRNTTEIHQCMKAIYNPIILTVGDKTRVIAGTTTDLNDREFIQEFQEQIIADHSGPPYNIEFLSRQEWAELVKSGMWSAHYKAKLL
jgi:hypothetical protein